MKPELDIWILDPFHAGSHAAWSQGLARALEKEGHRVTLHTLPGRHWKWRMHGAAATWAPVMADHAAPDVLVTTDMCDVAQLRGLMPRSWSQVRVVTMFHENQLTFPWSPDDPDAENGRDNTYAYLNISTCLASDRIWFNSSHHREAFLDAAEHWMRRMPKPHLPGLARHLQDKSEVRHLGLSFNAWRRPEETSTDFKHVDVPLVVWNHRWSWDKGTDAWMAFVDEVVDRDLPVEFVVLGASFGRQPEGWEAMRERMGNRCLHWGYADSQEDYQAWLWRAHLAPIQPHQEYFGLSVVEAMRCRTLPWVPSSHAYTDTMPRGHRFMPSSSWADGIQEQAWKTWPLGLDRYEQHALTFGWDQQGPLASKALHRALASPSQG